MTNEQLFQALKNYIDQRFVELLPKPPAPTQIGPNGEVYLPVLAEIQAQIDAKYPEGFLGPDAFTSGGVDLREKITFPKALMWPNAPGLTPEQKATAEDNAAHYRFLMRSHAGKWLYAPAANAMSRNWMNRRVVGAHLPDVWTTPELYTNEKDLSDAIRYFAKWRLDL